MGVYPTNQNNEILPVVICLDLEIFMAKWKTQVAKALFSSVEPTKFNLIESEKKGRRDEETIGERTGAEKDRKEVGRRRRKPGCS